MLRIDMSGLYSFLGVGQLYSLQMEMRVKSMEEDVNVFIANKAAKAKEDKEAMAQKINNLGNTDDDCASEYSIYKI